jgi:hypothetical protein
VVDLDVDSWIDGSPVTERFDVDVDVDDEGVLRPPRLRWAPTAAYSTASPRRSTAS